MDYIISFFMRWWEILLFGLIAWRVYVTLRENQDLDGYGRYLKWGAMGTVCLFITGWILGAQRGSRWVGLMSGGLLALPGIYLIFRVCDRAFNDMLAGCFFDMVFSEGPFADRFRASPKMPNLTLLRHWREHGLARKALKVARKALSNDRQTFPVWLFAMETAVVHLDNLGLAEKLARRLHRSRDIDDDQKTFAMQQLKGWAAVKGVNLNVNRFAGERPRLHKAKPLQEADRLRRAGFFNEAESLLLKLRQKDPDDLAAALLLLRIYTQDMRRRDHAEKILAQLNEQPHTSGAFVEFARRSLDEWSRLAPAAAVRRRTWLQRIRGARAEDCDTGKIVLLGSPLIQPMMPDQPKPVVNLSQTVEELIADGRLETALQLAEQLLAADPENFTVWIQSLEILTVRTSNLRRAEGVCEKIQAIPTFSPEQKQQAWQMLRVAKAKRAEQVFMRG